MQALSLAAGPAGINYFAHRLVVEKMVAALAGVNPPDRTIPIPNWDTSAQRIRDVVITLSSGRLSGFRPAFDAIAQRNESFDLTLKASAFSAGYHWHEDYWHDVYTPPIVRGGMGIWVPEEVHNDFWYAPYIGTLTTVVALGFNYDQASNTYRVVVGSAPTAQTTGTKANVPGGSIIQTQEGCFTQHVSDASASAVASIDFATPIGAIFAPLIDSIAASGHLTPDITYDFAVGDSGVTFPGGAGLAIGITGTVKYKDTPYSGTPPANLPVPPPPSDDHHLQLYVSNYEMDALYWAFWKAGGLAVTVQAGDLQDPAILRCRTYAKSIKAFAPYAANTMQARIVPTSAPTTAFQKVWVVTNDALVKILKPQLPSNVYTLVAELVGNAYTSQAGLEADLAQVDKKWWPAIETATGAPGMVATHDLEFTLTIQTGTAPEPCIVFDLARTDILQNLGLGRSGKAQTLIFDVVNVSWDATFVSSTVPNFARQDGPDFGNNVWLVVGEPEYEKALAGVGAAGSPLPMMSGFSFRFADAAVNIQEGYVSILAHVTDAGA